MYTGFEPQTLKVTLRTDRPEVIRLRVSDAEQTDTFFTNRYKTVAGEEVLYVRMPLSPRVALVEVYNERIGNVPLKEETTFTLVGIEKAALERKMVAGDVANQNLRAFLPFLSRFCYNAGRSAEGLYQSDCGRFNVSYQDVLRSKSTGKVVNTPARIGEQSGLIEFSKTAFVPMTVPMRMVIGLHEFSHFYLNENGASEIEADKNALWIYLGLGFPRIEAYQAFLDTFKGANTPQNQERAKLIDDFITEFETTKTVIYD